MASKESGRRVLGILGGGEPSGSVDVWCKLLGEMALRDDAERFDIVFEQPDVRNLRALPAVTAEFKLQIFDAAQAFERQGIAIAVLPCLTSHTFIDELRGNVSLEIVDLLEGLRDHISRTFPGMRRIGVLTSGFLRGARLFERYFHSPAFEVLHATLHESSRAGLVDDLTHGREAIVTQGMIRPTPEVLRAMCLDLIARGAELVVPGLLETGAMVGRIGPLDVPIVDSNLVYARYAAGAMSRGKGNGRNREFKVGVVGGVGPAATVDFMQKIVRNTPAARDQDHIKLLVEQNPQIPDRTANLVGTGEDPTLPLYATCKRLEAGGASVIAIPCNTAHAFVERIQPHLKVPVVNMLTVTVDFLRSRFPSLRKVGLLATTGTIASRLYGQALGERGLTQLIPGEDRQARVMNSIYGSTGVKAGFTSGACIEDITAAVDDLIGQGADAIILGCTELPLLLPQQEIRSANGRLVHVVDPTDILARRCVEYARGTAVPASPGGRASVAARSFWSVAHGTVLTE